MAPGMLTYAFLTRAQEICRNNPAKCEFFDVCAAEAQSRAIGFLSYQSLSNDYFEKSIMTLTNLYLKLF